MAFALGRVIRDGINRLTTTAGGIVNVGLAVFSVMRSSASQDVWRGTLERLLAAIEGINRGSLGARQREALAVVEETLEAILVDLPLARGWYPGLAIVRWSSDTCSAWSCSSLRSMPSRTN